MTTAADPPAAAPTAAHERIATVWRMEAPRIVAALARMLRDLGEAEELAQDALVAALERWPASGLPHNPGAWLMASARNAALDRLRHRAMAARHHEALAADREALGADIVPDIVEQLAEADDIGDDLLRLVFAACHPVLPPDARLALTLKVVCGLTTAEIANACLAREPTVAQRLVRARHTLAQAGVRFEVPQGADRAPRLASVLEVVYLMFNEGYAASGGPAWTRPPLVHESLRLARQLAALAPGEPEVLGLGALLELQACRLPARHDALGRPVLLDRQDRGRWDRLLLRRGLALCRAAQDLAAQQRQADGRYALQAAIAAEHARAPTAEATDWPAIAALYQRLQAAWPTPVVMLNRAVAMSRVPGADPAAALALAEAAAAQPAMADYPWCWSVRGDLLQRAGHLAEARAAFAEALSRSRNPDDAALMQARLDALNPRG